MPDAESAILACNEVVAFFEKRKALVVFTQTYKPEEHAFFEPGPLRWPEAGALGEAMPGQYRVEDRPYGRQTFWPRHCVIASPGSAFDRRVYIAEDAKIIRKGHRPYVDSNSAFFDADRVSRTGLEEVINRHHVPADPKTSMPQGKPGRLFVIGLSYDGCVRYTAEEAKAISRAAFQKEGVSTGASQLAGASTRRPSLHTQSSMAKKLFTGGVQVGHDPDRPRPRIGWGEVVVFEDCTRLTCPETPEALLRMRDHLTASGVKARPPAFDAMNPTPFASLALQLTRWWWWCLIWCSWQRMPRFA